ncbi:subtilisin-like protein, partial [Viridothelium virens]
GRNVDIYIFDSGINISHPEFGGRASNFQGIDVTPYYDGEDRFMTDTTPNRHGTCIASLAGGRLGGAAKHANIINVKVCGIQRSAESAGVVRALGDVRKEHNAKRWRSRRAPFAGSVINMSFGGIGYSRAMATAIKKVDKAGIPVVVSAGNLNTLTYSRSPCNIRDTICVAAVDNGYRKANWSNYGPEVAIAAPGQDIICASFQDGRFGYQIDDGTSLATAYVSGTLAQFISYEKLRSNTALVRKRMVDNSIDGILEGFSRTTPNRLNNN